MEIQIRFIRVKVRCNSNTSTRRCSSHTLILTCFNHKECWLLRLQLQTKSMTRRAILFIVVNSNSQSQSPQVLSGNLWAMARIVKLVTVQSKDSNIAMTESCLIVPSPASNLHLKGARKECALIILTMKLIILTTIMIITIP